MDQTQAQAWAEQRCCPQKKRPMLDVMMCRSSAIKAERLGSTATRSTAASNGQTEARCGKGSFHVLVPGATGIVCSITFCFGQRTLCRRDEAAEILRRENQELLEQASL